MSKFSPRPTENQNRQHPNENSKDYASRLLRETFRDVFYQASGRNMTFEFQEVVSDNCTDIVDALMQAVQEESRTNW